MMTTTRIESLTVDEVRWTLAALPSPDPLVVSDEDLIVATLIEAESYRGLARAGVHALAAARIEHERLRESHHHLVVEYRRLRESSLRSEAAA